MSKREPRFEIVRTSAKQPFHGRFIAANGREIWRTSENYVRRQGVDGAIDLILDGRPRVWSTVEVDKRIQWTAIAASITERTQ